MGLGPKSVYLIVFALAAMAVSARADDQLSEAQLDQLQWKFSSFLTGDTAKVRDIINGPLEQQLNRKAAKQQQIADDKAAITAKEDATAAKLRAASPAFAKLQDDLVTQQAAVATARKSSDSAALIKAQNAVMQDQQQIKQQENSALANDPEVAEKQKEIADTQAELRKLEPAIANATKARDQLVDGLRISIKIPGPPIVGAKGFLGRVTPIEIVDAHSFTTNFEAIEVTGENKNGKAADGFKSMTGKLHRFRMLVTNYDTAKLHLGTETLVDRTFSITGTQQVGKTTAYVVAPLVGDQKFQAFDYLFQKLDDLRVGKN